jgi:tRNA A37 threonylcarbamoyladenosine dehydratase
LPHDYVYAQLSNSEYISELRTPDCAFSIHAFIQQKKVIESRKIAILRKSFCLIVVVVGGGGGGGGVLYTITNTVRSTSAAITIVDTQ